MTAVGERMVLVYGDSNSHGTVPMATLEDMGRFGPAERWPGVLAAELGAGWLVREEGLPGRTTVYPDPVSGVHKNGLAVLPAILESDKPFARKFDEEVDGGVLDLLAARIADEESVHREPAVEQ